LVPEKRPSKESTGEDCAMSTICLRDAFRDANDRDDIAEFLETDEMGSVPPIWPEPINAILGRAMFRKPWI